MATKKKSTTKKKTTPVRKKQKEKFQLANEIAGILLIAFGLIMAVSVYSASQAIFISWFREFSFGMFGALSFALPALTICGGILAIAMRGKKPKGYQVAIGILGFLSLLSFVELCCARPYGPGQIAYFPYIKQCYDSTLEVTGGGVLGGLLAYPVALLLDKVGALILFGALIVVCVIVLTGVSFGKFFAELLERMAERKEARRDAKQEEEQEEEPEIRKLEKERRDLEKNQRSIERAYKQSFEYKSKKLPAKKNRLYIDDIVEKEQVAEPEPAQEEWRKDPALEQETEQAWQETQENASDTDAFVETSEPENWEGALEEEDDLPEELSVGEILQPVSSTRTSRSIAPAESVSAPKAEAPSEQAETAEEEQGVEGVYQMPPIDLLNPVAAQKGGRDEAQSKAEILEKTLRSFRIDAKVIGTSKGPTVTRYELQPAAGVKVSKIVNLSNDIALNMAASSIRIEAPIPGKAAIGIEVPNDKKSTVTIREMLDTDEFRNHKSKLAFAVGKDISGKNVYGDLAKMPHLLIAGTTGAGKSVCVNGIIMSYLYHTPPSELEIVMVDPKVVEMEMYNGIPYLLMPVITDPKKAAQALNQSVTEMLNRYKLFAHAGVKDIDRYNLYCKENGLQLMKKRVIIVDELADLMMASSHEVEDAICRIAQLGRASGIHLIIATQSPRVDVITGLIKANIPSRIALTVSSAIDSRTILDAGGAEKLLYNGDMLYMPVGASKPIRLQGCYVTDQENERVLDFIKGLGVESNYDEEFVKGVESAAEAKEESADGGSFEDELIPKAIQLALEYEQISISMLQRRLKVGYARAARLVDEMEANGFVSAADGSKPRQVLITWEEYHRMFGEGEAF